MNSAVAALLVLALSADGFRELEPGIEVRETTVSRSGSPMKLWLYRPTKVDVGARLPLVLVAPAGSLLVTGVELGDGDRVEHLPYVRAGFAVAAFSLDGPVKGESTAELVQAARSFQAAHAGVDNARAALEAASKALPIDFRRVYAAGHSSAGTLALILAAEDSRVKGVAAYAPATAIRSFNPALVAALERVPGYTRFIDANTPDLRSADITVPVFLFRRFPVQSPTLGSVWQALVAERAVTSLAGATHQPITSCVSAFSLQARLGVRGGSSKKERSAEGRMRPARQSARHRDWRAANAVPTFSRWGDTQ